MKNIIFFLLFIVISCKTTKEENNANKNGTTFYFIRHAEKQKDGTKDPSLSVLGKQRATNYINYFKGIKLDAIYSTNYKRTLQTAKPIAIDRTLTPIIYNPFKIDFEVFKTNHKNKTVLIVGHSNTTPKFANKMIGKEVYKQMSEDNFSNIYKVTVIDTIVKSELLRME